MIGWLGTVLYQLGSYVYIGVRDPMNKWPNATVGQQIANVLTFRKAER